MSEVLNRFNELKDKKVKLQSAVADLKAQRDLKAKQLNTALVELAKSGVQIKQVADLPRVIADLESSVNDSLDYGEKLVDEAMKATEKPDRVDLKDADVDVDVAKDRDEDQATPNNEADSEVEEDAEDTEAEAGNDDAIDPDIQGILGDLTSDKPAVKAKPKARTKKSAKAKKAVEKPAEDSEADAGAGFDGDFADFLNTL